MATMLHIAYGLVIYSAFLAQQCHVHILDQMKLTDHIISVENDMLVNRTRIAIYLDDVSFIGHNIDEVTRLQLQYERYMDDIKLHTKPSKRIEPTCNGCDIVGLSLNGITHRLSLPLPKLSRLIADTEVLLRRHYISGSDLQRIVGRWTWAALVRRPSLSIFNSVYAFGQRFGDWIMPLWASCRRELNMMMGIAPLLFGSLSLPYCPWMVATDASMTGIGVVSTPIPATTQLDISSRKHSDILTQRSLYRNNKDHEDSLQNQYIRSPLPHIIPNCQWSVVVSSRWRYRSLTINELEARAVKTAIVWLRSRPLAFNTQVLLLSDSSVVTSVLNRGRSSARALRVVTRGIAGHLLASGIHLHVHWIPTNINPADSPSRTCM
jgi:hypothetical protein